MSLPIKKCIVCGLEFQPKSVANVLCSAKCRRLRRIQNATNWQKAHPQGADRALCRLCGRVIATDPNRITNSRKFHRDCIIKDCKDTLLAGKDLTASQRQRLGYCGMTKSEFLYEVRNGKL